MEKPSSSVRGLSDDRIRSLLALGLSSEARQAPADPAASLAGRAASQRQQQLEQLLADLQSPVDCGDGPLSLARLTGLGSADMEPLRGKNMLQVFASSRTTATVLRALCDYGKLLSAEVFPPATRLAGVAICALSQSVLASRYGVNIEPEQAQSAAAIAKMLSGSQAVPKALREQLSLKKPKR